MSSLRAFRTAASALRNVTYSRPFSQQAVSRAMTRSFLVGPAVSARSFSVSSRAFGQGESDVELTSRLKEEIIYEKEAAAQVGEVPEFVQEFTSRGIWKIEEQPGHDEIAITRTFGNETIRVLFSIADIDAPQEAPELDEDGQPVESDDANAVFPIRCAITITKPDMGALSIDCVAEEGNFAIDNVSYYVDAKLATELTAEADWRRRGLYIGPQFDHLDVGVQEAFEKYLEERDIGPTLATFIPDYAEFREQKEYTKWLDNVHKFISA
ncbi:Mitochondrial acidic protein mam33 [Tulasnella sp. 403]|nr:Mitochondrial acidic protein mam33 [Tulasnella sp. 403]